MQAVKAYQHQQQEHKRGAKSEAESNKSSLSEKPSEEKLKKQQ